VRKREWARLVLLAIAVNSCGYTAVHSAALASPALAVTIVDAHTSASAAAAIALGIKEALAQERLLRDGEGYPRVEIVALRVDRIAGALQASAGRPTARAITTVVTGRAVIAIDENTSQQSTGDVQASVIRAASGIDVENLLDLDATRAAGRRLGLILGRKLLGEPAPSESP
jgi:hypothetical protein